MLKSSFEIFSRLFDFRACLFVLSWFSLILWLGCWVALATKPKPRGIDTVFARIVMTLCVIPFSGRITGQRQRCFANCQTLTGYRLVARWGFKFLFLLSCIFRGVILFMPPTKDKERSSSRMTKLAAKFKAYCKDKDAVCWLCYQRIDYDADGLRDPFAFHLDHLLPWTTHPESRYDWENFRASHRACNLRRGNDKPRPKLGKTSRAWLS